MNGRPRMAADRKTKGLEKRKALGTGFYYVSKKSDGE